MRTIFFAFIAIGFLSAKASAVTVDIDPSIATAAAIAPDTVIQRDLEAGVWSVHPRVGYFSGSTHFDGSGAITTVSGMAGSLATQLAFGDHFGLELSGLYYSGSGQYTPGATEIGATTGACNVSGWMGGATFVLDFFSGTGFRLPIFFGLNYQNLSSATPTSPTVTSLSLNSMGSTFGISPRFNLFFLRIEPFIVVTTPFNNGNIGCSSQVVSGLCGANAIQIIPIVGINTVIVPWNLSFYFNASTSLLGSGIAYYSAGPQFSF